MTVSLSVSYLLFDLDGTLVNSNQAVEATWKDTIDYHNLHHPELPPLELQTFLHVSHGTRTVELLKKYFPYLPNEKADISKFEESILSKYGHFAKPVNGASELISLLNQSFQDSWAIVTSGTSRLAHGWVEKVFVGTTPPPVFITADDVVVGKPNPEGYLAGHDNLAKLNGRDGPTVVFEDAPTGIAAGVAAGFVVIGIATTFSKEKLISAGATHVIQDMSGVHLSRGSDAITLTLDAL